MYSITYEKKQAIIKQAIVHPLHKIALDGLVLTFACALGVQNFSYATSVLEELKRRLTDSNITKAQDGKVMRWILAGVSLDTDSTLPTDRDSLHLLIEFLEIYYPNFFAHLFSDHPIKKVPQSNLIDFPISSDRLPSKALVIAPKHWWPGVLNTREHELYYILPAIFLELNISTEVVDAANVQEVRGAISRMHSYDVVLFCCQNRAWGMEIHEQLSQALLETSTKSICFFPDAWAAMSDTKYDQYLQIVNCVWGSPEVIELPECRGIKPNGVSCFPLPIIQDTVKVSRAVKKSESRVTFRGSIEETNFPRLLWYCLLYHDEKFNFITSSLRNDGLDARTSYHSYVKNLATAQKVCNFGARSSGEIVLTGRYSDTIYSGSLLIQQRCPEIGYFFVEDEHFVGFSSYEELLNQSGEYEHTGKYRGIADEALKFADSRYTAEKFVRHFMTFF